MSRVFPTAGARVEIDIEGGVTVARTVTAVSIRPDSRLGLTLEDSTGALEFLVLTPVGDAGWSYASAPINLARAIDVAERVLAGATFYGPAAAPERLLAAALLEVTGLKGRQRPCRVRVEGKGR